MFLLRLAPVLPFNLFNYMVGITTISLKENFLGYFGYIPVTVFEVYAGGQLKDIYDLMKKN